jgi:hypothetical protein
MNLTPLLLASLALVGACGASDTPPRATAADPVARPPDSLALTTRRGVEVWFTDSRQARDSSGGACLERVMELRQGGERHAVPLLYTGAAPREVDDSTIEARIWLNCRPGNTYRVNLRTGLPTRIR